MLETLWFSAYQKNTLSERQTECRTEKRDNYRIRTTSWRQRRETFIQKLASVQTGKRRNR